MRAIHNYRITMVLNSLLFLMSKIRTYESNSQLISVTLLTFLVVPDVKDTNL